MTSDELSSTWRHNFYAIFTVEKHAIDEKNTQAIGSIIARQAAQGLAYSGATVSLIATELANSLPERVCASLGIMQRLVDAERREFSIEDRVRIVTFLQKLVADQQQHLKHKALATSAFRAAPQAAQGAALRYIDLKANLELNRIAGEVDLMASKKTVRPPLDQTAKNILIILKEEFVASGRSSSDLQNGYLGPSLPSVHQAIMANGPASLVDFDLSLSALEKNEMVRTGPVHPYENEPGSGVFIFAMISKREYLELTEEGYRAATIRQEPKASSSAHSPTVNIHGGHFVNSPVGAGVTVTQTLNFDVTNETETINYLYELLSHNNGAVDASTKHEIKQMVDAANAGDMKTAKPIFQKLFGGAASTVKELATGVLTAIVNKQLGLSD